MYFFSEEERKYLLKAYSEHTRERNSRGPQGLELALL